MILMVIVKLGDINGLSKGYITLNVGHMKWFYNYYTFAFGPTICICNPPFIIFWMKENYHI